ncbi:cytochrome c [Halomonas vilamensis]|uniref:Cytochrome c n=1 Tax=Vreelandella vilamensis TaxID=531309 RepID=A0ABU1H0W6_9GAMM|nr:cytochrome c [Halomonas vilamensis]MDR5897864.1 cytochrome c [Halomonas vilamensis]
MKKTAFFAALIISVVSVPAVAEMSVDDQIETRQSAYQFAAWNGKKIKAWAIEGSEEYSEQDIIAAANAIAAVANSGMGTLFSRDSANDRAENTRLKPNFFNELDNVKNIALSFAQESNELKKVVADGDRDAVAQQFNKVVDTCKSCHDNYRAD